MFTTRVIASRLASRLPQYRGLLARRFQPYCKPRLCSTSAGAAPKSLLEKYQLLLEKRPLITTAWTSACIVGFGDILCQLIIESDRPFDLRRLCTMSFLGGSLIGPTLFFWYGRLAGITGAIARRPGAVGSFAKLGNGMPLRVLLDQSLFAPAFVGVCDTACLGVLIS